MRVNTSKCFMAMGSRLPMQPRAQVHVRNTGFSLVGSRTFTLCLLSVCLFVCQSVHRRFGKRTNGLQKHVTQNSDIDKQSGVNRADALFLPPTRTCSISQR